MAIVLVTFTCSWKGLLSLVNIHSAQKKLIHSLLWTNGDAHWWFFSSLYLCVHYIISGARIKIVVGLLLLFCCLSVWHTKAHWLQCDCSWFHYALLATAPDLILKPGFHMSGKSQTIADITFFRPSQILPMYRTCAKGLSQIFPIMNYLFAIPAI